MSRFRQLGRQQRVCVALTLLYSIVFLAMLVIRPGSKSFYHAFFNTYQILPPLFAGLCGIIFAVKKRRLTGSMPVGWLLVGFGCLSFACGQTTWTYYESVRGVEVPFPGMADAGYLGTFPFILAGVALLFKYVPAAGKLRRLVDGMIAAGSIGLLSWYFVVQRLWAASDVSQLGKWITIAYPLGDVAILFGAILLFYTASASSASKRSFALLAVGISLITFGDTTFTVLTLNEAYETGGWSDWAWSFGWLLIAYSFLVQLWSLSTQSTAIEKPVDLQRRNTLGRLIPYASTVVAIGTVLVHDYWRDHTIATATILMSFALMSMVVVRQLLTLTENDHLTNELKDFSENLELMVSRRTQQIESLHSLTKAINSNLSVDDVLSTTATHTRNILKADGVAIWMRSESLLTEKQTWSLVACEGMCDTVDALTFGDTDVESIKPAMLNQAYGPDLSEITYVLRVPLRWQDRVVGMIAVSRNHQEYTNTDCYIMESIGLEAGTALENARLYAEAIKAADVDSLTGLLNHRSIHQQLQRSLEDAEARSEAVSVIMMDMDNFKLLNDTYGHPIGDQLLKTVASTLKRECRDSDFVARYGGDEFIVVMPETAAEEATAIASRLRERMLQQSFRKRNDDRQIPLTLSFGIAVYPEDGDNRHELLTVADANLYKAKNSDDGIGHSSAIQRVNKELRAEASFATLDAIVTAVDNKDRYTRRHSEDVTEYALWIAEELGLSAETLRVIRIGGLLHDVGKIGVPDEILRKPGRLSPEEYEIMQRHPRLGALIVSAIPGMESILDAVRSHHERWDGKGYPDALEGEEIPLVGRIMAVADAFSAMTTDRPYRKGMELERALREIEANAGTQFDPTLAEVFIRAAAKRVGVTKDLPKAA